MELDCFSIVQGQCVCCGFAFQQDWKFAAGFSRKAFLLVAVSREVHEVQGGAGGV